MDPQFNNLKPGNVRRRQFLRATGLLALSPFAGSLKAADDFRYHTVRRGDTLSELAETYELSPAAIRDLNRLSGDQILVGQRLKVGRQTTASTAGAHHFHTVARGDTLSGLAAAYGASVTQIMRLNGLHSDNIRIGQKLKIGGAGNRFLKPELVRVSNLDRRLWRNIIAHHSAIREGNAAIYGRAHKRRGMINGLAYHFVIGNGIDSGDGEIEIGPRWKGQIEGGHVKSRAYNLTSIGVCLIGDFEKFKPSANQLTAFRELVSFLKNDLLGGKPKFYVHKDLEQTACPGKNFPVSAMHKEFD